MDECKVHYCKLTNTVATNRIKLQIKSPPLPSSSQIVEIGRSTPWNLYCTSLAPWHERLNNSFLQLLQLWRATYISNIDENIIIEKRQLTFPILNLFFCTLFKRLHAPTPCVRTSRLQCTQEILIQEILTKALQFPAPRFLKSTTAATVVRGPKTFRRTKKLKA